MDLLQLLQSCLSMSDRNNKLSYTLNLFEYFPPITVIFSYFNLYRFFEITFFIKVFVRMKDHRL